MSKKAIAFLIAGIILVFGIVLTIGGFVLGGGFYSIYFDENGIHTEKGNENYMSTNLENFKNIDIQIFSGTIELIKSDKNAIEYDLGKFEKVTACDVIDGTFTFKTEAKLSLSIFNFKQSYVRVYFKDSDVFENVSLKTTSGSIYTDGLNAKNVSLKSSSGSNKVNNVVCENLEVNGSSGSIKLDNIKSDSMALRTNSGSIALDTATTNTFKVNNSSGSIKVYNLNSNETSATTISGSIYVQGTLKGKTNLKTTSGSIKAYTDLNKNEYGYSLSASSGSTKVDDETFKGTTGDNKANFIDARASSGSVKIYFNSRA